jgi:hypothetical protein
VRWSVSTVPPPAARAGSTAMLTDMWASAVARLLHHTHVQRSQHFVQESCKERMVRTVPKMEASASLL